MKTGILGGTFDPPHNGHLAIAAIALKILHLNRIVFIPSHRTPLKSRPDISSPEHRWNMLQAAIKGKAGFEISDIELYRPGTSYTIDTIKIMRAKFKPVDEIFFIMGWDSLKELPRWKEVPELIKLCKIVAFTRLNGGKPDMKKLEASIPGLAERSVVFDIPPVNISSTEIREKVRQGLSIRGMVPQAVEKYIREHRLYS